MKSRFLFSIFLFNGTGIELQLFFFNANDKAFFIAILAGLVVDSVYSLETGLLGLHGYGLCMASIDYKPIQT